MKKSNRGFMLVETLVATTIIVSALLFIYIQYSTITNNYMESFSYNTTNGLYAAYNIKNYILEDGYETLISEIGSHDFLDITNCQTTYFDNEDYCSSLVINSNIVKLLFTYENVDNINYGVNDKFKKFINRIVFDDTGEYRLLIQFKDNTFATILLSK